MPVMGVTRLAVSLNPSSRYFRHPCQQLNQRSPATPGEVAWDPLQVETRYDGLLQTTSWMVQRESNAVASSFEAAINRDGSSSKPQ